MIESKKLEKKIKESGLKKNKIAETLGISRQSLHFKVTGQNDFRASEINKLSKLLKLTRKETLDIFLR